MIDQDDAAFKAEIDRISKNIKKTMKKIENVVPAKEEKKDPETEEKKDGDEPSSSPTN